MQKTTIFTREKAVNEYKELNHLHKSLLKLCNSITKDIIQTDVEWMNLKALSTELNQKNQPGTSQQKNNASTKQTSQPKLNKNNFEPVELPQLDLSPQIKKVMASCNSDEEFDSD